MSLVGSVEWSAARRRIEAAGRAYEAKQAAPKSAPPAVVDLTPCPFTDPSTQSTHSQRASLPQPIIVGQCHAILSEVATKHGLTVKEIISASRMMKLVIARHEAYFRCAEETDFSLPALGRIFHRDHTTVGFGIMRHAERNGLRPPRGMAWSAGTQAMRDRARRWRERRRAAMESAP